jgi:UDP:flavonoid glycosyltransferase YjiC (YdhE family)
MLVRVRVLISSTAGQGHVQPMIPLARALLDQGHDLVWAAPPEAVPRIAAAGFDVRRSGQDVAWCGAEYARRWPEARDLPMDQAIVHMYPRLFADVAATAALPDLTGIVDEFRPDLVVHEAAEYAAARLAARLGVPAVTHGIGLGIRPALVVEACTRAGAPLPATVLDICPPSLRPSDTPPPPGALPLRTADLEPLPGDQLPHEIAATIDGAGGRPVVHLTFGTVYASPDDLRRTARALAALDLLVVVSGALDEPVPGVVLAQYAPYSLLLPRCAAVVSQAGAGVAFKTLAAGVPQVCVPKGATDQFRNASAIERAGAGLRLVGPDATPEAIAEAVRRLLDEGSFARAASRLSAEIAAMPSPADVVRRLAG